MKGADTNTAASLPNILVTGATGFLGSPLITKLAAMGFPVFAMVRSADSAVPDKVTKVIGGDITTIQNWQPLLQDIDTVIQVAARAHIMNDDVANPLEEFRKMNTEATLHLARQAAEQGIKRFVFISSIKVNGEMTRLREAFKPDDDFVPDDPYGLSKYEAEQGLLALAKETEMEVVIIRPPLVYGPGVRANFASMMKWVKLGIPLPFGAIHNKRSFIALDNLISFIIHCIDHPNAANEIFLISDGEDLSTSQLLRKLANAFSRKILLLPIPVSWMSFAARLIGKSDLTDRLFGSLQVDSSKATKLLDWQPVISMDAQLKKTADAFLATEAQVTAKTEKQ